MDSVREPIIPPNPQPEAETVERKPGTVQAPTDLGVEVPYTESNFLGDYFQLGELKDFDEVYDQEIGTIDAFIQDKINSGEIANSQKAVKNLLKGMERFNNLKNEERPVVRLGVVSNYAEFLIKNQSLMTNLKKYGTR